MDKIDFEKLEEAEQFLFENFKIVSGVYQIPESIANKYFNSKES